MSPTATNVFTFDAVLFDMDGTLINSIAGIEGAWESFADTYPGLNVPEILAQAHGIRTADSLRRYCGLKDPKVLEREAARFEMEIINCSKKEGRQGIIPVPGAKEAVHVLEKASSGSERPLWAVCTSATHEYASQALNVVGYPDPRVFVAAQDVQKGKPHPDPYLVGAKRAGVDVTRCLVVEDAPAGIRSGRSAGAKVLGLLTSHSLESVQKEEPNWIVDDLSRVTFAAVQGKVVMTVH